MRRGGLGLARFVAIGLIAVSLLFGAAAGDSGGSAAPLTHQFPLGTKTLSRSTTTAANGGSTTTPTAAPVTTQQRPTAAASPTTQQRPTGAASSARTRTDSAIPSPAVLALIGAMIAVALLSWAVIRSSRRRAPRGRHEISPALERLLGPLFRYDPQRYALVLRGVGRWFGPVLHRRPPAQVRRRPGWILHSGGHRVRWSYEPEPEDDIERAPPPLPIRGRSTVVSRARSAARQSAKRHTPREQ
jgi:hypothetical protein